MKRFLALLVFLSRFLPYLIVFVGSLFSPSDPDLGWHLKYGEYFFQHGKILHDNTFSVMMPDFHWANVSWGTDILTFLAYHFGGFLGLSLLSAIVVTLTFFFLSKAAWFTVWDQIFLFPILLFLEKPINYVSFRGQQISLLLITVLFYLLVLYQKKPKVLYFLLPLFLIWTNLHGEFLLGLGLFFVWIITHLGQKAFFSLQEAKKAPGKKFNAVSGFIKWIKSDVKEIRLLSLIFLGSCLVTLINPFGIGVHLDAISHFGNPLLKDISEYLPFDTLSQPWWNQVIVAMFLLIGLMFFFFKGKLKPLLPILACGLLLFILSFAVRRYAWPAYYLIIMFLQPLPAIFKPDGKKILTISSFVLLLLVFSITISSKLPLSKYSTFSWITYCNQEFMSCSPASANYLKEHPQLTHHLLSLYGWGGWLIWNYPQIKPTIDGRMHLWKDEKGYSGFVNYYSYEQNQKDIDSSAYDTVYMSPDKPIYNRMLQLVQQGEWKIVFQDKKAGIFVRR